MIRKCYLFGADPSIKEAGKDFAMDAGGKNAHIVLLILRRKGWEEYLPRYTSSWEKEGVKKWTVIMPEESGTLDVNAAKDALNKASGIFIGGGDTERYYDFYATEPIRSVIRERYFQGVPVAGCSAGAILLPKTSIISPNDTRDGEGIVKDGLGLLKNIGISVHFSEWNDRSNIENTMKEIGLTTGYGIDEKAVIYFQNETYYRAYGEGVHLLQVPEKKLQTSISMIRFREVVSEREKQTTCERMLRMLPEWFGIESATQNYVNEVKELPMIVAELGDEVVGFISIMEHTTESDEIHLIAVNPAYHRLGIGKMLTGELENRAVIQGKKYLSVKTLSSDHPDPHYRNTRVFYEGIGFTGIQVLRELWGESNPCLMMVKKL